MATIEDLLHASADAGASDLHLSVGIPPKCRINGELADLPFPPQSAEDTERIVMGFMTERQKGILADKGEVDFSYSIPALGRYRVNIFRQRGSYALVIRLVGSRIPTPEQLGLPPSVVELTKKKRGLVLVTGPTGSGKSTSLASLIDVINSQRNAHIITLEDPIEYLHAHKKAVVNQREIGLDTQSYGNALRAALREDPDVILVGEMRDLETIDIALTAAETGHLVFSTLHTIGAAPTIDRVIDVFPPHQQSQVRIQLGSVLEAVISQQLIPTLDGKGRIAAFEVMHGTVAIKNLIREGKSHQVPSIIQTSKKLGMITMDDAIYELFLKRKIGPEEALSFAQDMQALERKLY